MRDESIRQGSVVRAMTEMSRSRLCQAESIVLSAAEQRTELARLLSAISADAGRLVETLQQGQLTLAGNQLSDAIALIDQLRSAIPEEPQYLDEEGARSLAELSRRIALIQPDATLAYVKEAATGWKHATVELASLMERAAQVAQALAADYLEAFEEVRDVAAKLDEARAPWCREPRYGERQ